MPLITGVTQGSVLGHCLFSEKTLMKNVNMCYIGVTDGKIENLKKEGKMSINI